MKADATHESYTFTNVRIVSGEHIIEGSIVVEHGIITAIAAADSASAGSIPAGTVIDGQGGWLLPGFIDVHVHGGFGADFMDATEQSYDTITKFHASHGTTGMLATTVTASPEAIEAVLEASARYQAGGMPYAALLGVHLEGPFLSEKWIGAQNPAFIAPPRADWLAAWEQRWPGLIRQMTLAPEKEGSLPLVEWLRKNNINVACGHTDASYEQVLQAIEAGLNQAAHTYNAMTGLHHRSPGTLGAVLSEDAIYAEIIPDGIHVHPAAIRVLAAAKPADKLVIITDAMSAAGLGDGLYDLGGLAVVVSGGIARLQKGNNLAGSTLTMNGAIKLMVEQVGVTIQEASRQASGNPAQLLGIADATGSIAVGKRADLVLLNTQWDVQQTWVAGRNVWAADA
ncbi:N-acetylglucosamine-6-phosphate deacetylase [Paenibacillus sp. MMS18-CY102]|uniref:N-acetylglucosamine-6-phosphate deacetylase n=1 Tax=Paenibacillus sp. MMS18-CY102 TaxID=2682849 RepID=UPI00136530E0|nr:N-acetylglucosamine-6-phosphate deacetylase [Paenibacillus sp. MMS18-CY102]MWC28680.1 N-acetylglucosamine-6-phosphate deacetylase [Paenibacillus sp. MMS18-CY102]